MLSTIYTFLLPLLLSGTMQSEVSKPVASIKWYTWEEAIEANKTVKKKFIIDLYTDWCGWCKVMDNKTFTQPEVADYINKHFYAIKFDAEQKTPLVYKNYTFKHLPGGRKGIHELAYSLMDGKASYPTLVYLNEAEQRIFISPGYKKPDQLMKELRYAEEEGYKDTNFADFQ